MDFFSNPTPLKEPFLKYIRYVLWSTVNIMSYLPLLFNSLRPRRSRRHFADDIFKCIFLNEYILIPIKISLKFFSLGFNKQCWSIGSDNGLTSNRRQAIVWSNDDYCIDAYTPTKKVLGHLWFPLLCLLLWWFSCEALSISPRVLISEVSFVWKSISRIMNLNNLHWLKIFDYLYSLEKWLIASQQTSRKISVFHVNLRFVQNVIQTINPVHLTKFGMQEICLCHEVYPGSSQYCLN